MFNGYAAVIPISLRERIMKLAHESPFGIFRTKEICRFTVCWPGMDRDNNHFIGEFEHWSVADKGRKPFRTRPFNPIPYPSSPWTKLALDIHGPMLEAPKNIRYLLVLVDIYSKRPGVQATASITNLTVVEFFSDCFVRLGLSQDIIPDNVKQFTSAEFDDFLSSHNTKQFWTALYRQQSKGELERFNLTIVEGLRAALESRQAIPSPLRALLATYRLNTQRATGRSFAQLHLAGHCAYRSIRS
jgi:hypothetical protein